MVPPRDSYARLGSVPGRAPGLLTATRPHPWWLNANSNAKKIASAAANAGNAGKSVDRTP